MIKNVKWIFVVLIISSLISFSFVGKNTPTEGLTIGDKAPTFTICGEKQLIDLKDLRGKYVLLSFWASYDALSRMQNATLNHAVAQADNVEMVSVSFDEYKSIFNETIKKDQISTSNCFVELAGVSSDLYQTYRLKRGFKNFLLDENGVIVAKDITVSELSSYLNWENISERKKNTTKIIIVYQYAILTVLINLTPLQLFITKLILSNSHSKKKKAII